MDLSNFIGSSNPHIHDAASKIAEYQGQLNSGQISKDEYNDLCKDVLDISAIENAVEDLDQQEKLKQTFDVIRDLATSFPL